MLREEKYFCDVRPHVGNEHTVKKNAGVKHGFTVVGIIKKKFYKDFTFTVFLLPRTLCTNPLLYVETHFTSLSALSCRFCNKLWPRESIFSHLYVYLLNLKPDSITALY